jgi:hypothetical protein
VFREPAPRLRPLPLADQALEAELLSAARAHLPFVLEACLPEPLRAHELADIARRLPDQRLASGWGVTGRGWASPEETIPRTTVGRARPRG